MNMFQEIQLIWRAKRALWRLPKTGEAIASYLEVLEIKGVRKDICHCPIANYLRHSGIQPMVVTADEITIWDTWRTKLDAPVAVSEFIRAFDAGSFDNLVSVDSVKCWTGGLD